MSSARKAPEPLYEPQQAAELIGRTRRQLDRIKAAGAIGHVRIGRRVLYRQSHIDTYLAQRDRSAAPEG